MLKPTNRAAGTKERISIAVCKVAGHFLLPTAHLQQSVPCVPLIGYGEKLSYSVGRFYDTRRSTQTPSFEVRSSISHQKRFLTVSGVGAAGYGCHVTRTTTHRCRDVVQVPPTVGSSCGALRAMVDLHNLASKGDVEGVRKFLRSHAAKVNKTNRDGQTALHCCAKGYAHERRYCRTLRVRPVCVDAALKLVVAGCVVTF